MFIYKASYSLSLVLVLLNFVFLISHAIGQDKNDCNFVLKSRNGFLKFPTKERCHTYFYEIEAELNSSIIKITSVQNMNENDAQDYFGGKAVSKLVDIEKTIVVTFTEKTTLKDGRTFPIPLEEWKLTTQNLEKEHLYLSRTSHLSIRVTVIGNWTAKIVTFSYEELPFKVYNMYTNEETGQAIKIRQSQDTNGLCAEDNIYSVCPPSFTLPKLHLTDELGRRFTLNYSDTMAAYAEDNDPKIEAESVWTRRRSSRIQELLNMRRSNRSSILRAEINEGYEDDENSNSITTATAPEEITNEHHETENLYDSLKSSKSLVRTKGTSTTKL